MVKIQHSHHIFPSLYYWPQGGCFCYFLVELTNSMAEPTPIRVVARNIPSPVQLTCFFIPCSLIRQFFLHDKDIFCYFGSFSVNSGHLKSTSTTSTQFLLMELVVVKHGRHVVSCSYWQPRGGCFAYSWCSPKGCAMLPTSFNASKITSIENLLTSYLFKCQGTLRALTMKII